MYCPKSFEDESPEAFVRFVKEYPLSLLTVCGEDIFQAYIPLVYYEGDFLGHIAKANPLQKYIEQKSKCVFVFLGPHAMIPAGFHENDDAVPTWNYEILQCKGEFTLVSDDDKESDMRRINQAFDPNWSMDKLTPERKQMMMRSITPFRLSLESYIYKRKHSQNKSLEVQQSVIRNLARGKIDAKTVADRMRQHF